MTNILDRIKVIKENKEKLIIGLMSGTSLDGLDIALCKISGFGVETKIDLLAFDSKPYSLEIRNQLESVCFNSNANLEILTRLNIDLAKDHGRCINQFLAKHNIHSKEIDMIASHGQTVYHIAKKGEQPAATLQIGDGDVLAVETGILTISDFRMKHIAYGGEGAPLAPYGDVLLFADKAQDTLLINLGGISNFTFVPNFLSGQTITFSDLGPANTLMNQWAKKSFGKEFDKDGNFAKSGKIDKELLSNLLSDSFYDEPMPKTTGPEHFNLDRIDQNLMRTVSKEDVMATLNMLTTQIISDLINEYNEKSRILRVYISGGGVLNIQLLANIKKLVSEEVNLEFNLPHGINYDAKESVFFAMLANEIFADDISIYKRYGLLPVKMGKISFP